MKSEEESIQSWIRQRQGERADSDLLDRIMAAVEEEGPHEPVSRSIRFMLWVDRSRWRRRAACLMALMVGAVPFAFFAYFSQFFAF